MRPTPTPNDVADMAFGQAESRCDFGIGKSILTHCANSNDLFRRHFAGWITLAVMVHSALRSSIHGVVLFCSQKKMIWIATRRVVAFVTNTQSDRYFSFRQHVGHSVASFHCSRTKSDHSVSESILRLNPFQTSAPSHPNKVSRPEEPFFKFGRVHFISSIYLHSKKYLNLDTSVNTQSTINWRANIRKAY